MMSGTEGSAISPHVVGCKRVCPSQRGARGIRYGKVRMSLNSLKQDHVGWRATDVSVASPLSFAVVDSAHQMH